MKAGDADAPAAEARNSSSAETAAKRGSAETTNPAAETANRATPEATTPKPTATEAAERGGSVEAATEQFEVALFFEARYVRQ